MGDDEDVLKALEDGLRADIIELKSQIEENELIHGIPSKGMSSLYIPKDPDFFRRERKATLQRMLHVAEPRPITLLSDLLQKEIDICEQREYNERTMPIILHQDKSSSTSYEDTGSGAVYEGTSRPEPHEGDEFREVQLAMDLTHSHSINVTDDGTGQDGSIKQGTSLSSNGGPTNDRKSVSETTDTFKDTADGQNNARTLTKNKTSKDELDGSDKRSLHSKSVKPKTINVAGSQDPSLSSIVIEPPKSDYKFSQHAPQSSAILKASLAGSKGPLLPTPNNLSLAAISLPLGEKSAASLPVHTNDLDTLRPHLIVLCAEFGIQMNVQSVKSSADEMELFSVINRKFRTIFQRQEDFWTFKTYDNPKTRTNRWGLDHWSHAVVKPCNWRSYVNLKPRRHEHLVRLMARLRTESEVDCLLTASANFVKLKSSDRVQDSLRHHAMLVQHPPMIHPASVASHRQGHNTEEIFKRIFENPSHNNKNQPEQEEAGKRQEDYDFTQAMQMLGLDDAAVSKDDPSSVQGAYLSYLHLRHLKLREATRSTLSVLNYFRSIERTLTINDQGLSISSKGVAESTKQNHRSSNQTSGTQGGSNLLDCHGYLFDTPQDFKIKETEFMQFAEVENHDDFYFHEEGRVHVRDQVGFWVIYDCSIEDFEKLEKDLLLLATAYIQKDVCQRRALEQRHHKRVQPEEPGELDIAAYANRDVDRIEILHDLWTNEMEFQQAKQRLMILYMEAYQHIVSPDSRRSLAQVITNLMHQRPRFDMNEIYFVTIYRYEIAILQKRCETMRFILDHQINRQRDYLSRVNPADKRVQGLPPKIIEEFYIAPHSDETILTPIYLMEFHPSLACTSNLAETIDQSVRTVYVLLDTKTPMQEVVVEKYFFDCFQVELEGLKPLGGSYTAQLQRDLFSAYFVDDPMEMGELSDQHILSIQARNSRGDKKTRQLFLLNELGRLLDLVSLRHRLIDCMWECEVLSKIYLEYANDMGYENFHLFIRPVQFEAAKYKEGADELHSPIYITSIQDDDSVLDKYLPSSLPLAIHELDETHVGKFSFRGKVTITELLETRGVENLTTVLKAQVTHKNALTAAVLLAYSAQPSFYTAYAPKIIITFHHFTTQSPSRDRMQNAFIKRTQGGGIGAAKSSVESEKMKREFIGKFCSDFGERSQQAALRSQIITTYTSILKTLAKVPTLSEDFFVIGYAFEKKGSEDDIDVNKTDPRVLRTRPRRVLSTDGTKLQNLWFVPHFIEVLFVFRHLNDQECTAGLQCMARLASALHDILQYTVAYARLGISSARLTPDQRRQIIAGAKASMATPTHYTTKTSSATATASSSDEALVGGERQKSSRTLTTTTTTTSSKPTTSTAHESAKLVAASTATKQPTAHLVSVGSTPGMAMTLASPPLQTTPLDLTTSAKGGTGKSLLVDQVIEDLSDFDGGPMSTLATCLREIEYQINQLSDPTDPIQVVQLLSARRDVMFLQLDVCLRTVLCETFLAYDNQDAFDEVKVNSTFPLVELSNVHRPCLALIPEQNVPEPLQPHDIQAQTLFPWRALFNTYGPFFHFYTAPLRIEYNLSLSLAGLRAIDRPIVHGELLAMSLSFEDVLGVGWLPEAAAGSENYQPAGHTRQQHQQVGPGQSAENQHVVLTPGGAGGKRQMKDLKKRNEPPPGGSQSDPINSARSGSQPNASAASIANQQRFPTMATTGANSDILVGTSDMIDELSILDTPLTAYELLKKFLVLWKRVELLKYTWGHRRLGVESINTPQLFKTFCTIYKREKLYPLVHNLAIQYHKPPSRLEGPLSDTSTFVLPEGIPEIVFRQRELHKLIEAFEFYMIGDLRKLIVKQTDMVIKERNREEGTLPLELWKKPAIKETITVKRPALADEFAVNLLSKMTPNADESLFNIDAKSLNEVLQQMSNSIMRTQRESFESYSMYYENVLKNQHNLLYSKDREIEDLKDELKRKEVETDVTVQFQMSEQAHNLLLEVTALRTKLTEQEFVASQKENRLRNQIREEFSDSMRQLFGVSFEQKARIDEYRNRLHAITLQRIAEVREEASVEMTRIKERSGARGSAEDELAERNLRLSDEVNELNQRNINLQQLMGRVKIMSNWQHITLRNVFSKGVSAIEDQRNRSKTQVTRLAMLSEERVRLLNEEVAKLQEYLAQTEKQLTDMRTALDKEMSDKIAKRHTAERKAATDKQMTIVKQMQIDQLLNELEEKETKIKKMTLLLDENSKTKAKTHEKSGREVDFFKKQLYQERKLKRAAMHKVDELTSQLYEYETAYALVTATQPSDSSTSSKSQLPKIKEPNCPVPDKGNRTIGDLIRKKSGPYSAKHYLNFRSELINAPSLRQQLAEEILNAVKMDSHSDVVTKTKRK